jgi:hypothetical protein
MVVSQSIARFFLIGCHHCHHHQPIVSGFFDEVSLLSPLPVNSLQVFLMGCSSYRYHLQSIARGFFDRVATASCHQYRFIFTSSMKFCVCEKVGGLGGTPRNTSTKLLFSLCFIYYDICFLILFSCQVSRVRKGWGLGNPRNTGSSYCFLCALLIMIFPNVSYCIFERC